MTMEMNKRVVIAAISLVYLTVCTLTFVHHIKIINAFTVCPFQTKEVATKTLNRHYVHIIQRKRELCDVSRIGSTSEDNEGLSTVIDDRRRFIAEASNMLLASSAAWMIVMTKPMSAHAVGELPDRINVDDYLKTGMVMNPMGVSGQAGKSKPVTGM